MRLTLRTLLAYLDDILEPEDAEDISRRIQESEVASALMHRVRDVMRRLRLEAPLVEETGKDLDPNTVAEYLDHVLPDERVPDFERVCLESDIHLAEVASCHQILALVLGEPAEVDPASREHMYALPQVAADLQAMEVRAAQEPVPEESIFVGVEPPPPPRRPRPVVPDYLREPRRRRHPVPWIIAAVLLVGLIVVGYLAAEYFIEVGGRPLPRVAEQKQPAASASLVEGEQSEPPVVASPAEPSLESQTPAGAQTTPQTIPPATTPEMALPTAPGDTGPPGPPVNPLPPASEPISPGGALPPTPTIPPQTGSVLPPTQAVGPGQLQPAAPGHAGQPAPPVTLPPAAVQGGPLAPGPTPATAPPASPAQPTPAGAAGPIPSPLLPEPTNLRPGPSAPGAQPSADLPGEPGSTAPSTPTQVGPAEAARAQPGFRPAQPPPAPPVTVARFVSDISENQVLLQWDPQARAWNRVSPQAELVADGDLLALPVARPLIELTGGLNLQLRDGTQIGLHAAEDKETPRVTLKFGRLLVSTPSKADARLPLTLGSQSGTLVFVDPESRAALEMTRSLVPGADPEKEAAEPITEIYALAGHLVWEADDGTTKVEFKTPSRVTLAATGHSPPEPVEFPRWIVAASTGGLDRLAFKTIEEGIPVDRAVTLGLREKLEHRRKEVRWLARRCLGYVGDFGPLVAALDKPDQRSVWTDYLDQIREGLARGPETAANVRAALERAYGAEGSDVYRMLWGYTPAQLEAGQDVELIKALGSDLLAARVVGFWNLNALTGWSLYYRPEDTAAKRQQRIREWEKRQQSGELQRRVVARIQRETGQAAPAGAPVPASPNPAEPAPAPAVRLP